MLTPSNGPLGQLERRASADAASAPASIGGKSKFDLSRFRSEQVAPLAQFRPYIMVANVLAVLAVAWVSVEHISGPWLYLWATVQFATTGTVFAYWVQSLSLIHI